MNSDSSESVGDATNLTSLKYFLCLILSVQVLTLVLPYLFYMVKFTAYSGYILYFSDNVLASIGNTTGFSGTKFLSIWLIYLTIAATSYYQICLKHIFFCIYMNMKSITAFMYLLISSVFFACDFIANCTSFTNF